MSHHTEDESFKSPEKTSLNDYFDSKKLKTQPKSDVGATGSFPNGKIADNDEGSIQFRIAVIEKVITFDFGKSVHSIGFTKDEAIALANHLYEKARSI